MHQMLGTWEAIVIPSQYKCLRDITNRIYYQLRQLQHQPLPLPLPLPHYKVTFFYRGQFFTLTFIVYWFDILWRFLYCQCMIEQSLCSFPKYSKKVVVCVLCTQSINLFIFFIFFLSISWFAFGGKTYINWFLCLPFLFKERTI